MCKGKDRGKEMYSTVKTNFGINCLISNLEDEMSVSEVNEDHATEENIPLLEGQSVHTEVDNGAAVSRVRLSLQKATETLSTSTSTHR